MSTEVSKVFGNTDGFAESVQQGWLQFAQNRVQWRQFVKTWEKDLDVTVLKSQCDSRTSTGGPSAPGELVVWWWPRVASIGGLGGWTQEGAHLEVPLLSWLRHVNPQIVSLFGEFDLLLLS